MELAALPEPEEEAWCGGERGWSIGRGSPVVVAGPGGTRAERDDS